MCYLQQTNMMVTFTDHDDIEKPRIFGRLEMGLSTSGVGYQHWRDMLKNPAEFSDKWHKMEHLFLK